METLLSKLIASQDGVSAFFTTRRGGVSQPPYDTANLAFHVGDKAEDVVRNHDLLAATAGYERQRLVHMRQVHSDRIVVVDESLTFDTPPECDALITNVPDIPLMVMSADCTPILLYDPATRSIGAVHAGRAGALTEILPKTVRKMGEVFGSRLEDLYISMGPSIHGCCYEINDQIADDVIRSGYPSALRSEDGKVYLDVNTVLTTQLERMGFLSERLEMIDECTSCRCDTYFSYRADRQRTGRISGVIMLRA